jgi:branched-chain amino acid transport system permease protein
MSTRRPSRIPAGLRSLWETDPRREPGRIVYLVLIVVALFFPLFASAITGGGSGFLLSQAGDAGVYILLALGLNVVVGFAGLLDLGYAAFFAIGAYTAGMLASTHMGNTPVDQEIHLPFWIVLFIAMFMAALFGVILGAPTLRLRGDYLAIVTLGFGEIVPRVFRNGGVWTNGVNGISSLDVPTLPFWPTGPWAGDALGFIQNFQILDPMAYYVLMVILLAGCVILANNLHGSRLGRAWMAIREDEVAAAAMGINTVRAKLLAFALGAAFSGFAGAYFGTKLSLISPENFTFIVSITVLVMVVLGGMGNIPGVLLGALLFYYVSFNVLPELPHQATKVTALLGLSALDAPAGEWPGTAEATNRLKFLLTGLILVLVMLLRPQGLLPSREREQELTKGTHEDTAIVEVAS